MSPPVLRYFVLELLHVALCYFVFISLRQDGSMSAYLSEINASLMKTTVQTELINTQVYVSTNVALVIKNNSTYTGTRFMQIYS
jgi:hypothetical protein